MISCTSRSNRSQGGRDTLPPGLYRSSDHFTLIGYGCDTAGSNSVQDHGGEGCFPEGLQEPGTNEEIKSFCTSKYQVTFPMFDKIHVKGSEQAPLYTALTGSDSKFPGDVKWNFGKFLIGRNGEVLARFEPKVKPDNPAVVSAIEAALIK